MRTETRQIQVTENEQGERLDVFLTRRYHDFSRNEWQVRIAGGYIRINGIVARPARRLNTGDTIEFSYTMRDEPETPTEIPLLFEDDDYLVINKPAGLPVHPSGIYRSKTVTTLLMARKVLTEGYLLHRLDRETSGVLVLAKNRIAAAAFQKVLRSGGIDKDYQVITEGKFPQTLDAEGHIYRLSNSHLPRRRFFTMGLPPASAIEAQSCRTSFKLIKESHGLALIAARLFTGRMHQIRATLWSLGYPVVGDKLYGLDPELYFKFADGKMQDSDWQKMRITRSALHCHTMALVHPLSKHQWLLNAPLPEDMQQLLTQKV